MRSRALTYAPLAVFGVVYLLSCLVGTVLLIVEYRPFVVLFEYFSGTDAPHLTSSELRTNLMLLVVAPLMLVVGYELCIRCLASRIQDMSASRHAVRESFWPPILVFAVFALIGLVSLLRSGAVGRGTSWIDYGVLVQSRAEIFSRLTFFEFVNLYVLIPTAAAWVAVSETGATGLRRLIRWAPVGIALLLSLFLFSRKVALTVLLITFFAWAIKAAGQQSQYLRRLISAGIAMLAILYCILVVAPVYSEAATTASQAAAYATDAKDPERARRAREIAGSFGLENRKKAILLYSVLSPLTRTSAPSLYYPVIYPRLHDYYGLDVGQDVLGIGAMPDDNLVVWNHLNPGLPGGATSVSYQFALYSQVGTHSSIALSFIIGFLLAGAWLLSFSVKGSTSYLLGAMVLLLAVYLAVDSLRNSLLVSYGVIWGLLFIGGAATMQNLVERGLFHRTYVARASGALRRSARRAHVRSQR